MTSMTVTIDEQNIKRLLKEALLELLEERQDIFLELLAEVVEEGGMLEAIKEGENSEYVEREEVLTILSEKS